MTVELYLQDSYAKEAKATVTNVEEGTMITLDRTIFYPQGGGQPYDVGTIIKEGEIYQVSEVKKRDGKITHFVDRKGLVEGDTVQLAIDWPRRYKLMRAHTSAHVLSEVIHGDTGALITGNQLGTDKVRIDFALEEFNPEIAQTYLDKANEMLAKDLPINISFLPREEALRLPGVSKLAKGLPPNLTTLRIVDIGGFDVQADGGTHVKSTKEVGKLKLIKVDNKGKNNRRLVYELMEGPL